MRPHPPNVVARIKSLLSQGKTQRQVCDITGASKGTVSRIEAGTYRPDAVQFSEDSDVQTVRPYVCPSCHKTVTTAPCVACAGRKGQ